MSLVLMWPSSSPSSLSALSPLPSPLLVQALLPQMQALSLLGADPSVILQAGAVREQMHAQDPEQDVVEEVSLLKYREEDHL